MLCHLVCNGKSVLDWIKFEHPVLLTEPHADLLTAVKTKMRQIIIQIHLNHVKGHQDGKLTTVLPRDAWLHVEANLLVKAKVDLELPQNSTISTPRRRLDLLYWSQTYSQATVSHTPCAH